MHRCIGILIHILIGAILSIALAWVFTIYSPRRAVPGPLSVLARIDHPESAGLGVTEIHAPVPGEAGEPGGRAMVVVSVGWPAYCLRKASVPCDREFFPPNTVVNYGGVGLFEIAPASGYRGGIGAANTGFNRRLPALPLWGGLLMNTAFWASASFAVVAICQRGVRKLADAFSRDPDACAGCGYPHSGSTYCPECGRSRDVA